MSSLSFQPSPQLEAAASSIRCSVLQKFALGLVEKGSGSVIVKGLPARITSAQSADTDPQKRIKRSGLAADWLVRIYAPAWLRVSGRHDVADALSQLGEISATPQGVIALRKAYEITSDLFKNGGLATLQKMKATRPLRRVTDLVSFAHIGGSGAFAAHYCLDEAALAQGEIVLSSQGAFEIVGSGDHYWRITCQYARQAAEASALNQAMAVIAENDLKLDLVGDSRGQLIMPPTARRAIENELASTFGAMQLSCLDLFDRMIACS